MKKKIVTTALVAAVALGTATATFAGWGQRGGGYWNNTMPGPGPRMEMRYNQLDPAVQEKLDKFFADTQDIRKEIAIKQAERMALISGDNPDPVTAGTPSSPGSPRIATGPWRTRPPHARPASAPAASPAVPSSAGV